MTRWINHLAAGLAVCAALAYPVSRYLAAAPKQNEPVANTANARPAAPAPGAPARVDVRKSVIELPTKALLANRSAAAAATGNPKVQPGKVRWHASFAAACAAARRTGKPVLLFQMLGKLDDQFC